MSDSISVRITLDSYDLLRPREPQTQVYVQIPEVARVSYMLPAERFQGLKDRAWPEVLDVADEHYERGWAVEDSTTVAARAAVRAWLRDDANRDEMQAAFETDHARRDPVARKLLEENERLRSNWSGASKIRERWMKEIKGRTAYGERLKAENAELRARIAELEAAQAPAEEYGPAFPWVALMDDDDRSEFLGELAAAALNYYRADVGDADTLGEVEKACGTWRLIAEAQHAHNTAPGPAADADRIVAYRNSDRPGVLLCREHGDGWMGLTPLTSENLPDGGLCTWGWPGPEQCGRDVLITEAGDPR
ncbi:hypothetical protein [Streptomyces sp. NPDC087525]|uniref:hypothetical protein n=1 Tax=Streptomyces sp. NPDC087525 TaxID=3365793 RepID=UPI0038270681